MYSWIYSYYRLLCGLIINFPLRFACSSAVKGNLWTKYKALPFGVVAKEKHPSQAPAAAPAHTASAELKIELFVLRREDAAGARELPGIVTQQSVLFLDSLLSQGPGTGSVKTGVLTLSSFTVWTIKLKIGWIKWSFQVNVLVGKINR